MQYDGVQAGVESFRCCKEKTNFVVMRKIIIDRIDQVIVFSQARQVEEINQRVTVLHVDNIRLQAMNDFCPPLRIYPDSEKAINRPKQFQLQIGWIFRKF